MKDEIKALKKHFKFEQIDMFCGEEYYPKIKHDMYTMEHQVFNLTKKKCTEVKDYEHNGVKFKVIPSGLGLPFIRDTDILTYCASIITDALNKGFVPSRLVRVNVNDYARATNRTISGKLPYDFLASLRRLRGAFVETNVSKDIDEEEYGSFGWIEDYSVLTRVQSRKTGEDQKESATNADILLSKWQYNAILSRKVLTLDSEYYKIKEPIKIAIYLIVRKHINRQGKWRVSIKKLKIKSGVNTRIGRFIEILQKMQDNESFLKYSVKVSTDKKTVTFYNHSMKGISEATKDMMRDQGYREDLLKEIPSDGVLTKERLEQIESMCRGLKANGADKAVIENIKRKMLTT